MKNQKRFSLQENYVQTTLVAANSDMRWIATASRDMTLRLWDNKADALCCSFKLQEEITSIAINSDGSPPAVQMGRFDSGTGMLRANRP